MKSFKQFILEITNSRSFHKIIKETYNPLSQKEDLKEGIFDWFKRKAKAPVQSQTAPAKHWTPEEGESKTLYFHTSNTPGIKDFHPLTHFGTSKAARARIYDRGPKARAAKHASYTVRLKLGKGAKISDEGTDHSLNELADLLHKHGHINKKEHDALKRKVSYNSTENLENKKAHIVNALKSKGYDHMYYINTVDDPGSKSVIITHSSQVRVLRSGMSELNQERMKKDSARTETIKKKLVKKKT